MVTVYKALQDHKGIFTVPEAALYARLPAVTMQRWLKGSPSGEHVIVSEEGVGDDRFVTFLDFIQCLAIREIRREHGISLQEIRKAVETAQHDYQVEFPLAKKHTTFVMGKEIFIQLSDNDDPIQISGRHKGQVTMKKVVELYLRDVSWDAEGIAKKYRPFGMGIVQDPSLRFGEPIVESCGISALALWEAAQSEGSIEAAAEAYGVSFRDVESACRYFDILEGKPRAA